MPAYEDPKHNLIALGEGVGSKVERIKIESNNLRGHIREELDQDTSHFSEDQVQQTRQNPLYSHLLLRSVVEGNERRRFCFINQVYLRERN
jgi:hypothetical protein